MPQNALVSRLGFPEFIATITTNHRAPLPLDSKSFLRDGDKCLAAHSNTLRPFPISKTIASTLRFPNPPAIGSVYPRRVNYLK